MLPFCPTRIVDFALSGNKGCKPKEKRVSHLSSGGADAEPSQQVEIATGRERDANRDN